VHGAVVQIGGAALGKITALLSLLRQPHLGELLLVLDPLDSSLGDDASLLAQPAAHYEAFQVKLAEFGLAVWTEQHGPSNVSSAAKSVVFVYRGGRSTFDLDSLADVLDAWSVPQFRLVVVHADDKDDLALVSRRLELAVCLLASGGLVTVDVPGLKGQGQGLAEVSLSMFLSRRSAGLLVPLVLIDSTLYLTTSDYRAVYRSLLEDYFDDPATGYTVDVVTAFGHELLKLR